MITPAAYSFFGTLVLAASTVCVSLLVIMHARRGNIRIPFLAIAMWVCLSLLIQTNERAYQQQRVDYIMYQIFEEEAVGDYDTDLWPEPAPGVNVEEESS